MSDLFSTDNPNQDDSIAPCAAIRTILMPEEKDLGGFTVRRLLPAVPGGE